jgi:hypothetical protein
MKSNQKGHDWSMRRIEQQASKVKEKYSYGIMFEIFAK